MYFHVICIELKCGFFLQIAIYLELATLLLGHSDFVGEYLAGRDGALMGGKVSLITVPFSNLAFRQ